jgi:hypothetical protein
MLSQVVMHCNHQVHRDFLVTLYGVLCCDNMLSSGCGRCTVWRAYHGLILNCREVPSLHHGKHIASSLEGPCSGSCFGGIYHSWTWEWNNTEMLCVAKCSIFSVTTGVAYCNHCVFNCLKLIASIIWIVCSYSVKLALRCAQFADCGAFYCTWIGFHLGIGWLSYLFPLPINFLHTINTCM